MHSEFQQLLWIAAFVTAAPFLFGGAALLFDAEPKKSEGAPTGEGAPIGEEKTRS
jgi:hypothetical protein